MFVKFLDMMLSLGHEGYEFKLGRKTSLHSLETKLNGSNLLAKVAEILVLC